MNNPRKKAFTLVELLVVIAILAILATTSVVGYTAFITKANISADEQEIAQLNGYLTLIGKVENATQLEQIVDQAFGEGKFSTLEPRSAQHGYHYWYDVQNNQVLLKTYQEIQSLNSTRMRKNAMGGGTSSSSVALLASQNAFANGDLRMFGNYYVMDANGIVVGAINSLNAFDSVQSVQQAVATLSNVKSTHKDSDFAQAVLQKVAKVAFVASDVTFVFNADQVETFRFADGVSTVSSNVVHNGASKNYVALASKVNSLSIPGSVQTVQENALVFDQAGVVRIHTQLANIQEISGVFHANSTNGIIVDNTNVEYTIDGGAISGGNQSANLGYTNPVESFDIVTPADTDDYKTVVGTLYVAYNYTGVIQLSASNFANASGSDLVSSTEVEWSCDHPNVQIDNDGKLSIVGVPTLENCTATITATAVAGGKTQTLTVYVVRPTTQAIDFCGTEYTVFENGDVSNIVVTYTNDSGMDFPLTIGTLQDNFQNQSPIQINADVEISVGQGNVFSINNNVLTLLDPTNVAGQTQSFTVSVAGGLLSHIFNISVNDQSATPFQKNLEIAEREQSFLFRVGNGNAIPLGYFFTNNNPANTTLQIRDYAGTGLTATVDGVAGASWNIDKNNWATLPIEFQGTGVAQIVIGDEKLGTTTIMVEVVEGLNVTDYSQLNGNKNNVLLNDIAMVKNDDRFALIGGTLYGNDFTFNVTKGNYNADPDNNGKGQISENYVILLQNGTLDNVQIIGKPFDDFSATAGNNDNICNVLSIGNDRIINCYITNCAAPVRAKDSNLEIVNTTLQGGSIANLDIRGGNIVLDNVTTINNTNDCTEGSVGLGIVVWYESSDATITIKNNLTQHNYMSKQNFKDIPLDFGGVDMSDVAANMIFSGENGTSAFIFDDGNEQWINTGIFSLISTVGADQINTSNFADSNKYAGAGVSANYGLTKFDGYLYTIKKENVQLDVPTNDYSTEGQGTVAPSFTWDFVGNDYNEKTGDADKEYCIKENGQIKISIPHGETKILNLDGMCIATKKGNTINYTNVYLDGNRVENSVEFKATETHVLKFEFDDGDNYNANGNTYTKTYFYEVTVQVVVAEPDAKHAEFTFGSNNTATEKITINNKTYVSAAGVSATDKQWGYITVGGTKVFYPIIEAVFEYKNILINSGYTVYYYVFNGTVAITDYKDGGIGDAIIYNASITTMPSNLTVVNGMEGGYTDVSSACVDISSLTKDGPSGEVWDFSASTTVSGTTKYSGYLAHKSPDYLPIKEGTRDYDAITIAQFSYTDEAGETYYYFVGYFMPNQLKSSEDSGGGGGCVTPDTLVTLADGTQKQIQHVTYQDQLLVWNFNTGSYAEKPASAIINHGEGYYTVVTLKFSDGTTVDVIDQHGFFDLNENKFVFIGENNVENYIGHTFVQQSTSGYNTVELVGYAIAEQYTTAYSILSHEYDNAFVEGMLSITPFPGIDNEAFYGCLVVGDNLIYDFEAIQKHVDKHGLYTYEELSVYGVSHDQFVGANLAYLKIMVGEGIVTLEEAMSILSQYVPQ